MKKTSNLECNQCQSTKFTLYLGIFSCYFSIYCSQCKKLIYSDKDADRFEHPKLDYSKFDFIKAK